MEHSIKINNVYKLGKGLMLARSETKGAGVWLPVVCRFRHVHCIMGGTVLTHGTAIAVFFIKVELCQKCAQFII